MPELLIESVLKVAVPLLAAVLVVPLNVPLLGLFPIATLTVELAETVLPNWS